MERDSESDEGLHIHLLGTFRVSAGRYTIPASRWQRKAANLVKLLALAPGHRLHREQITEALWPESEPLSANNCLHHTLYLARHILQPALARAQCSSYLRLQDELLILCPSCAVWTDIEAFEEATGAAYGQTEPVAYERALALYPGDLLPENIYDDWTTMHRERLLQEYLSLFMELAHLHEMQMEYAKAITVLRQLLAAEPAAVETHISLMRLYALAGQRYQALRQYQQLAEVLRREWGVEPDRVTQSGYRDLAAGGFPGEPMAAAPSQAADAWRVAVILGYLAGLEGAAVMAVSQGEWMQDTCALPDVRTRGGQMEQAATADGAATARLRVLSNHPNWTAHPSGKGSGPGATGEACSDPFPEGRNWELLSRGSLTTSAALTAREYEIVQLVACRLTNRQIATLLVLSVRTVDKHMTNILKKLHLSSRREIATWYAQQGC
jgi:DNA-binding SARP family transcriptional activator/DNA-binding CsgD family transcriptional regulator